MPLRSLGIADGELRHFDQVSLESLLQRVRLAMRARPPGSFECVPAKNTFIHGAVHFPTPESVNRCVQGAALESLQLQGTTRDKRIKSMDRSNIVYPV